MGQLATPPGSGPQARVLDMSVPSHADIIVLNHRPGPEGFSGFLVVHGHTPNDGRRDASHADQIAGFRLNLDAGSAMTGVAKMAIIRDRYSEVVSARGPAKREDRA